MGYGKYIGGSLSFAPMKMQIGETIIYNPSEEQLKADGYKPLVYVEPSEAPDGYQYVSIWEEKETAIEQVWTLEEVPPSNPTAEEILNILIGGVS